MVGSPDSRAEVTRIGKIGFEDLRGFSPWIAAVEIARRGERRAVDSLGQLRFHDISAAGIDGETRKEQQRRQT